MNRDDQFEKFKVFKASTNKVVTNVYMDAFPIEKVRFQNASYEEKTNISCYLDFSTVARVAADATSGRIFKLIEEDQYHRYTLSMGGTKKGADGKPVSKTMYLGMANDKVFINMTEGPGKLSSTGAIMPDGQPTKKISVGMSKDDFREMFIYAHDCVNAYLGPMIHKLVKESEEERKKNTDK